jgi:UDP-glucuronate 4-epimerase
MSDHRAIGSSDHPILITGVAGFIGFHLATRLLTDGHVVVGMDNLNDYYDPTLKQARLDQILPHKNFTFHKLDLTDKSGMERLFGETRANVVVHLAAQAGVRYSLTHPHAYTDANITGFLNVLEGCRANPVDHLIYASSSSVYGGNTKLPFAEDDPVDTPISLYAATKKANELMAHTYAHLYGIPSSGLRFFTVYGPWGRPDMAMFKFVQAAFEGGTIDIYNHGDMKRDFTYVDDIVEGIVRLIPCAPGPSGLARGPRDTKDQGPSAFAEGRVHTAPHTVYNIGNNNPEDLMELVRLVEQTTGHTVAKNMTAMQPGDVKSTYADIMRLQRVTGFAPCTPLKNGVQKFVDWYRGYYGVSQETTAA